jgi:undecaprenyl-diphosphatase
MKKIVSIFRRSFTLRVIAGFIGAGMLLAVMGLLAKDGSFQTFDLAVRRSIDGLESQALKAAMMYVTKLGSTWVLFVLGTAAVAGFAIFRWWRPLALFLIAMSGQAVLHLTFKRLFEIDRPPPLFNYVVNDSPSFPSGHAIASLSFYGILVFLLARRFESRAVQISLWVMTAALVILVGFSRIYLGVHHASDVIAGFLAAIIWTFTVASGDR